MSLTTEISNIINTKFPGDTKTYLLSSWFKANRKSFDIEEMTLEKPLIILNNELTKDKEIQKNANTLADTRIIMQFLVKGNVYENDLEMNTDIEALELIASNIMNIIYRSDFIRLKGTELFKYKITPKFKIYNSVLVGVEAEARIKENQLISFCSTPPEE